MAAARAMTQRTNKHAVVDGNSETQSRLLENVVLVYYSMRLSGTTKFPAARKGEKTGDNITQESTKNGRTNFAPPLILFFR